MWFYDTRGTVRRMGVSAHAVDSTVVISLWQGDICTGTFRLSANDAAGLISTLAYAMTVTLPREPPDSGRTPNRLSLIWSRIYRRLSARPSDPIKNPLRLLK